MRHVYEFRNALSVSKTTGGEPSDAPPEFSLAKWAAEHGGQIESLRVQAGGANGIISLSLHLPTDVMVDLVNNAEQILLGVEKALHNMRGHLREKGKVVP